MASPFRIPKKKLEAGDDSAHLHLQSPLSRLHSPAPPFKSFGDPSSRGGANRVHAGTAVGSSASRRSPPCKPCFRNVVTTLLGLNTPNGAGAANHRAAGSRGGQSQAGQRAEASPACISNGWRPKRASDRLLRPDNTPEPPSPPQKKRSPTNSVSVESLDSLAELRGEEHAGSLSSSRRRAESGGEGARRGGAEGKGDGGNSPAAVKQQKKSRCPPSRPSAGRPPPKAHERRSLDRTAWLAAAGDPREKERERWREFRERKAPIRSAVLRLRKPKPTPTEPIVLSSEEEEEGEDDGDGGASQSSRVEESCPGDCEQAQGQQVRTSRGQTDDDRPPPPSFLQLPFTSLHAGLTHADADVNGELLITENGIMIPLKGAEEGEVTVVASQVRGYGVWDGGVAQGGALLAGRRGPAPSLLFLWVTDAQANLLQRELSAIRTAAASGPSCSFLLLVLKEQLQELQAALLASILDMEEYRRGSSSSSSSSSSRMTSPLDWTDGLLLLHSCPPPLDQHLLRLLGHSTEEPAQVSGNQRNQKSGLNPSGPQQLSARLIQYPAAPCKGRITVTKEDLACLSGGEFLNDVIIDFYLKYLLLEGVGGPVAERSHVFSSFFYKQLSRRRAAGEDDAPSIPDRHTRHQRVKTWTRHVDIFTKDFLFVPVNQEAHWFLVVVCFPGLEEVRYEEFHSPTGGSEKDSGKCSSFSLRSEQPPECTERGWQKATALKRPCILVMDSLKLSYHENVCRQLRDYLQVEWEVRRGTPRLFSSVRSCSCRVPQQDNSSDCGLYLLQYAESFLQNPVVHFDLPLRLDHWFPRQHVRQKREGIRSLIMKMHRSQSEVKSAVQ
ncbi:sentrin-specific protease 7b [Pempheris klunzingeri]|uniref:sentrin-specific protease 7b n=1 Tax=Pempheris klunzingeri TaxID=3127111 RepID=UPI00397EDE94